MTKKRVISSQASLIRLANGTLAVIGLVAVLLFGAQRAGAQCRQALALGLDVSGSVDAGEYQLQMQGLANALRHPQVQAAVLGPAALPVEIAVYEWSAPEYQRLLVDWTAITDSESLKRVAAQIGSTPRQPSPPVTGLGQAMLFGQNLLKKRATCWKRTLDISGDGRNNSGIDPRDAKALLSDLTLNALVIGADAPHGGDLRQVEIAELSSYFRALVIFGPDAFVETALGFEDYEEAMVRKLLRELETLVVSDLAPEGIRVDGSATRF